MTGEMQRVMDLIEDNLKELVYVGGVDDPAVWDELRRVVGEFGRLGRVGTISLSGPRWTPQPESRIEAVKQWPAAPPYLTVKDPDWGEPIKPWSRL